MAAFRSVGCLPLTLWNTQLCSQGFRLILVLKGMLWLGSGPTLLCVSNTFVLRVVSPLLEAWIKVCHKGPYWGPYVIWFKPLRLKRSLSAMYSVPPVCGWLSNMYLV